mmetsp:Transcript_24364/g.61898  ORF Transcript_24364/g.61898 Transcript_24364/m.61898 type:complete len:859 (+) Transcript_24364:181-2757(+)
MCSEGQRKLTGPRRVLLCFRSILGWVLPARFLSAAQAEGAQAWRLGSRLRPKAPRAWRGFRARVRASPSLGAALGDEAGRVRLHVTQLGRAARLGVDLDEVRVLDRERLVGPVGAGAVGDLERATHTGEHAAREALDLAHACGELLAESRRELRRGQHRARRMADGTAHGADGAADRAAHGRQTIRRDVDGVALEPAEVLGPLAHDEEERERHVEPEGPAHEGDAVRVGGAELDQILDQILDLLQALVDVLEVALEQATHSGVVGEASELGVDAQLLEEDPRGEEVEEHGEGHHEDQDALDDRLVRLRRGVEHAQQVGLIDEDGDGQHEENHPVEEGYGRARDVAHDDELGHHLHPVDDVHARAVARVAAVHLELGERARREDEAAQPEVEAPALDDARDDREVDHHAVDQHEAARDVPVAVDDTAGVSDEGADGRERGEHLEADELEHLRDLLGGDRGVPHEGDLDDGHRDEDDEVAAEQHNRAYGHDGELLERRGVVLVLGRLGLEEGRGTDEEGAPEGEDGHVDGAAQLAPAAVRAAEVLPQHVGGLGRPLDAEGLGAERGQRDTALLQQAHRVVGVVEGDEGHARARGRRAAERTDLGLGLGHELGLGGARLGEGELELGEPLGARRRERARPLHRAQPVGVGGVRGDELGVRVDLALGEDELALVLGHDHPVADVLALDLGRSADRSAHRRRRPVGRQPRDHHREVGGRDLLLLDAMGVLLERAQGKVEEDGHGGGDDELVGAVRGRDRARIPQRRACEEPGHHADLRLVESAAVAVGDDRGDGEEGDEDEELARPAQVRDVRVHAQTKELEVRRARDSALAKLLAGARIAREPVECTCLGQSQAWRELVSLV